MKKPFQHPISKLLIYSFPFILVGLAISLWDIERSVWVTNQFNINSKKQPVLYALFVYLNVVIIFTAFYYTLIFCRWAFKTNYALAIFGAVIFLMGLVGLFAIFTQVPLAERNKIIHVIFIGSFFSLLGLFMIVVNFRKK